MLVVPASYVGVTVLHPLVSPENEFGNVIDVALGVAGALAAGADKLTLPVAVLNPLTPLVLAPGSPGSPLSPLPPSFDLLKLCILGIVTSFSILTLNTILAVLALHALASPNTNGLPATVGFGLTVILVSDVTVTLNSFVEGVVVTLLSSVAPL